MAEKLKNVPVLTGRDRYQTGRYALEHFDVDTLVLDDGFQHLALDRDLDILLFDHFRPLGNGHLFPAGELREPVRETSRADMVCFTRYSGGPINFDLCLLGSIPQIKTHSRLDSVIRMNDDEVLDIEILKNDILEPIIKEIFYIMYPYFIGVSIIFTIIVIVIFMILFLNIKICYST